MTATKLIINGEEHDFGSNGDMMYSHFNRETVTGNNISLHLNTYYEPAGNFTVNAPVDIKEGQTYLLRVDNGATAYTMSLGTGITNLQGTNITLTPNAIDMFVFLATKDGDDTVQLELQKEISQSGGGVYSFYLSDETSQTELDNLWSRWDSLPDEAFDSVVMIVHTSGVYFFTREDSQDAYFFGDTNMLRVQFQMEGWYTRTGVSSVTIEPLYTAGTGISISNNVISSTVEESNTKTFYLSSTSDLTNAQAAYDWYVAGKNPIIAFSGSGATYIVRQKSSNYLAFTAGTNGDGIQSGSYSYVSDYTLYLNLSGDTVTSVSLSEATSRDASIRYLDTNINYGVPYTPTYPGSPATKLYVDERVKTYYGGEGINIVSGWGDLLGWHIPEVSEVSLLSDILGGGGVTSPDTQAALLKLPKCGRRSPSGTASGLTGWSYWTSDPDLDNTGYAYYMAMNASSTLYTDSAKKSVACPIRLFKNDIVKPTSYDKDSWEELLTISGQTYSGAIYRNKEKGLITFDIKDSSHHDMSFTIADKNVGATKVWNRGDDLTPRNCGNVFQWGNSYGFPSAINEDAEFDTSSTQVNTSEYGWTSDIYHNYSGKTYFGDTFITGNDDRSSTNNDYLWGNHTIGIHPENTINNIIEESNTKTFYLSDTSDLITAQEILDYFFIGNNPIIVIDNNTFVLSKVSDNTITFTNIKQTISTANIGVSAGGLMYDDVIIYYNGTVVSHVNRIPSGMHNLLVTGVDYSIPYTPTYPGSPATKKYVDDSVSVVSGDSGTKYTIKVSHSDPSGVANNVITFVTPLLEYSELIALNNADAIVNELNSDASGYFNKYLHEGHIGEDFDPELVRPNYYYLEDNGTAFTIDGRRFLMEDGTGTTEWFYEG